MTDDIVTRLREYEAIVDHPFVMSVLVESADEIERLRALLVHGLTEGYDCEGCDLCEQLKAIHKEAVKNEF